MNKTPGAPKKPAGPASGRGSDGQVGPTPTTAPLTPSTGKGTQKIGTPTQVETKRAAAAFDVYQGATQQSVILARVEPTASGGQKGTYETLSDTTRGGASGGDIGTPAKRTPGRGTGGNPPATPGGSPDESTPGPGGPARGGSGGGGAGRDVGGAGGGDGGDPYAQDANASNRMHDIIDGRLSDYEQYAGELTDSIRKLRNERNTLKQEVGEQQVQLGEATHATAYAEKQAQQAAVAHAAALEEQRRELTAATAAAETATKAKEDIEAARVTLQTSLESKTREVEEAERARHAAIREKTAVEGQLTQAQSDLEAAGREKTILEAEVARQQALVEAATLSTSAQTEVLRTTLQSAREEFNQTISGMERDMHTKSEEFLALNAQTEAIKAQFQTLIDHQLKNLDWILLQYLLSSKKFWDEVSTSEFLNLVNGANQKPALKQKYNRMVARIFYKTPLQNLVYESENVPNEKLINVASRILYALQTYTGNEVYVGNLIGEDIPVDTEAYFSQVNEVIRNFKFVPFLVYFKYKVGFTEITKPDNQVDILEYLKKYTAQIREDGAPVPVYNVSVQGGVPSRTDAVAGK